MYSKAQRLSGSLKCVSFGPVFRAVSAVAGDVKVLSTRGNG